VAGQARLSETGPDPEAGSAAVVAADSAVSPLLSAGHQRLVEAGDVTLWRFLHAHIESVGMITGVAWHALSGTSVKPRPHRSVVVTVGRLSALRRPQ
jgi:hypothetical protein